MSIESGPRQYHDHEGDERRGYDAASMPDQTPTYEEPPRPDYAPTPSGYFDSEGTDTNGGWLRSGRARLLAGVAAGSVLIGGVLIGVRASGKEESGPEPVPSQTESVETNFETKAEYAPTIYETELYKSLAPEQQREIAELERMPYEDFRQQLYSKQMLYGDFYYQAYKEYGMEQVKRSPYYQKDTAEVVNIDSPGQDILNDFAAKQGTIFYSLAENGDPYNISKTNPNREEAKKALSLIYTNRGPDSNIYNARVGQLTNLENLEADGSQYNGDGYPVRKADKESKVGMEFGVPTKRINVIRSGEHDQYVYNYTPYKDIQGEERATWQLNVIWGEEDAQHVPDVENLY